MYANDLVKKCSQEKPIMDRGKQAREGEKASKGMISGKVYWREEPA